METHICQVFHSLAVLQDEGPAVVYKTSSNQLVKNKRVKGISGYLK